MVTTCLGLPHACGGVSVALTDIPPPLLSSPRMWGCFQLHFAYMTRIAVFPTHVGVFRSIFRIWILSRSLPHACGGVSEKKVFSSIGNRASPRMWGCFPCHCPAYNFPHVFPTHVGVFLHLAATAPNMPCLPHACGGVSPALCS